MTTIKITCPACTESLLVRCDLSRSESPIQVDYVVDGVGWLGTQWQCADARHTRGGLASIGSHLLCEALQTEPGEKYETFAEVIG